MKKKLSQVQVLAKELAKRPLTGKQIENELGILNYKGRIFDLRNLSFCWDGMFFVVDDVLDTEMIEKKTRWGKSRIARYFIYKKYMRAYKSFLKDLLKPAH